MTLWVGLEKEGGDDYSGRDFKTEATESHPEKTVVIPGVDVETQVKEGGSRVGQDVCK